jgi:hypothetical protein
MIAKATYDQALAYQGAGGELSKQGFLSDDKEADLGEPIARWTPYSGFKVLTENPDVQKYYPNEVPLTAAQKARAEEVRRHNVIIASCVAAGIAFFVLLGAVSGIGSKGPDAATSAWFNNTGNPELLVMAADLGTWQNTLSVHASHRAQARACNAGFADATNIDPVPPDPKLFYAWNLVSTSYLRYFEDCRRVLAARTPRQALAAKNLLDIRLSQLDSSMALLVGSARDEGLTVLG